MVVDIEGFEYELFRNVTLSDTASKIFFELHPGTNSSNFDLSEYLYARGFTKMDSQGDVNYYAR